MRPRRRPRGSTLRRRKSGIAEAPHTRAAPFQWRLVIMAKAPVAGRTKTRLAREAGLACALRCARHGTAAVVRRLGGDTRWRTALAVTPDRAAAAHFWPHFRPRGMPLLPQGPGDLGARMQRIIDRAPPGPVVIVGSDIPGIERRHVAAAFRLLGSRDAVLGPAADGGYWLVGARRRPSLVRPFRGVRWSTAHALADTLANLHGRSVGRVAALHDVDTGADWARCAAVIGRTVIHPTADCSTTANLLDER